MRRHMTCIVAALTGLASAVNAQPQFADAWNSYVLDPDGHPNIPNVSYAGFGGGAVPLPDGAGTLLLAVTNFGAVGDGVTDDTAAVRAAIDEAESRNTEQPNGVTVFFPPGTYRLSGPLLIHADNIHLRGFDRDLVTLLFTESLQSSYAVYPGQDPGDSIWSFAGGMIWFTDETRNPYFTGVPTISSTGDGYQLSSTRNIVLPADLGDRTIVVSSTSGISPGDVIVVEIDNDDDESTLRHLFGDGVWAHNYTFEPCCDLDIMPSDRSSWRVYHTVESVNGSQLTLAEPLRFDLRSAWDPEVRIPGTLRYNVGVSQLSIAFLRSYEWTRAANHGKEPGYNGIAFTDTINGFAYDIDIIDPGGHAIMMNYSKNITLRDIMTDSTGPDRIKHHHAFFIANSNDCLIEDFDIKSWPNHGLHVGAFCVNNVYSNGAMDHGTFDFHKRLPYANVFTEISIVNDGDAGGAQESGPAMGARHAIWNVKSMRTGSRLIGQPDIMPMGALVGLQCAEPTQSINFDAGDSQAIVESSGINALAPNPPNLYEAQLALRLGNPIPDVTPTGCCSECVDDTAYAFDFGGTVGDGLIGQDGWVYIRDFTETDGLNVRLQTESTYPGGPMLAAVSTDGRDSVISRQNDASFAYTPHDHEDGNAVISFDLRAGAAGGPSGNVYLILNNTTGDEGIQFGMSSSQFQIRGGQFSGVLQETASIPSGWYTRGEWVRLELRIDFTANAGEGAASLFFMNLSRGETSFQAVAALQNVPLLGEVRYPESWDRLEFRIRNDSAATNIVANPPAMYQCCEADQNNDGQVTGTDDVAPFVALIQSADPAADLDGNGIVDYIDLAIYLNLVDAGCP
ncbi:MAG: glycosyl hydrolase family 28-related protein [Planctomycetota bacterium]